MSMFLLYSCSASKNATAVNAFNTPQTKSVKKDTNTKQPAKKSIVDLVLIPIFGEVLQGIIVTEKEGELIFLHIFLQEDSEPTIISRVKWFDIYRTNILNPASKDSLCSPVLPYALFSKDCIKLALTEHLLKFRSLFSLSPTGSKRSHVLKHSATFINEKNLPELLANIQRAIEELKRP